MKLARFTGHGVTRIGKVEVDRVVDLSAVTGPGYSMKALLERLDALRPSIEAAVGPAHPLAEVVLEAPIDDPRKYLAIGMNYEKHAKEVESAGIFRPPSQLWFNKQVQCITGPYHPTDMPKVSDQLD